MNSFLEFAHDNRLEFNCIKKTYTPRRLSIIVNELQEKQSEIWIGKTGPSKKIAFNSDGSPTKALLGFVSSNKATVEDVTWEDLGKGEIAVVKTHYPGQYANELLPIWIKSIIEEIPFPKKMKWNLGGLDFARPVRWLLCLWGQEILPVSINGLSSDRTSSGNRYVDLDAIVSISHPDAYFSALKSINVIAYRQARYESIKEQLQNIFPKQDYLVDLDEGLLQTVTDLVEFPTAVVAEFEEKFLVLPEKIVTSTISTNQKYFAVKDKSGKLSNKFVFISNGNPEIATLSAWVMRKWSNPVWKMLCGTITRIPNINWKTTFHS